MKKTIFMGVIVAVVFAAATTMIASIGTSTLVQAADTANANAHSNTDNNGNTHQTANAVANEGGKDGYHANAHANCNSNNDKCTSHGNSNNHGQ